MKDYRLTPRIWGLIAGFPTYVYQPVQDGASGNQIKGPIRCLLTLCSQKHPLHMNRDFFFFFLISWNPFLQSGVYAGHCKNTVGEKGILKV